MGLFNMFKKKSVVSQKTFICARCKKEITDEESKWIGNHRFCSKCAAPSKTQITNREPKTFVCNTCGQKLDIKYLYKHNMCVSCFKSTVSNQNKTKNDDTQKTTFGNKQPLGSYRDKKYLRKLFAVYFSEEEQRERFVCYDTITGIPYLIDSQTEYEGHAIISSWFGNKLTYEQVALFAQNYAPTNSLTNINSDNWKKFFIIDNTTEQNSSTYTDSITRKSNMAFLSDNAYVGAIIPIHLDWCDIESSPRFSFAGAPHFDEISIGLIQRGKYINQLFITIINDGYPSRCGFGTAELLPEKYQSYEGIKHYVLGRDFSIYEPITEKIFNERMTELFNDIGH